MTLALDALNDSNPGPELRVLQHQARLQQARHDAVQASEHVAHLEQEIELAQIGATRANLHAQDLAEHPPRSYVPVTYTTPRWKGESATPAPHTGQLLREVA